MSAAVDQKDLRKAFGQFATGVAVITTRAPDGRAVGVTVNSFTSLSLDPPLVLFCLANNLPSHPDFVATERFAINVLAVDQHRLARQFATPAPDKFAGVALVGESNGLPLLDGVLARFVCRGIESLGGGDHSIFVGEVVDYERFGGEPLVFHSGQWRTATRHPDFDKEEQ